jgi:hypothetical protein
MRGLLCSYVSGSAQRTIVHNPAETQSKEQTYVALRKPLDLV